MDAANNTSLQWPHGQHGAYCMAKVNQQHSELDVGHPLKLVCLWCLAGRTNTSACYGLLPLLSSKLDLETLVSLCQASKQLHDQCLDLPDQLLQTIVQQAIKTKQDYNPTWQGADTGSRWSSLAWLLGALSKRWGIMQLAARLDLQQALLAAKSDSVACYILIRAGARITRPLLLLSSGPYNSGPRFWAQIYQYLQLCWDLPGIFLEVLQAPVGYARRNTTQVLSEIARGDLDSRLLFELAAAVSKTEVSCTIMLMALIGCPLLQTPDGAWTPEQVLELAHLAAKRLSKVRVRPHSIPMSGGTDEGLPLLCLLQMPSAQGISGRDYADLLVVLFSCPWVECMQQIADRVLPRVEWHQQLIEQIVAAVTSLPKVLGRQCIEYGGRVCSVCILLQALTSSRAFAHVPFQQQIVLFTAAAGDHSRRCVDPLLQAVSSPAFSTQPGDVLAAVSACLDRWDYIKRDTDPFLRLLQHQAVQQLQPAQVQLLLVKAVDLGWTESLECLLKSVPAARGISVEALQELLEQAITARCDVTVQFKPKDVAVLVSASLPAVQQLGPQELQLLLEKSFQLDDSHAVALLMDLPAAKQMPLAAACELMLQALSAGARKCLQELLQLVPQMEQVPLAVLQQVLPVLMKLSCVQPVLTPASVPDLRDSESSSRGCAVCSLLKASAGKLAAADVWEVLVAAATSEHVENFHIDGLATLPGVDELGDEQVEQLLMSVIEALEPGYPDEPWWQKLHELQGELLYMKQLPAAAVHRLMVACVGKAVEGGVGRLREELGLQEEGWEAPLEPEQFSQLLMVATRCAFDEEQEVDFRPCLLAVAKLLPSVREKQQVAEGLKAANIEYERGLHGESDLGDEDDLEDEGDLNGGDDSK